MAVSSKVRAFIVTTRLEHPILKSWCTHHFPFPADIVLNKAKTRSKGFGYVTFAKEEEARKAQMAMNRKASIY